GEMIMAYQLGTSIIAQEQWEHMWNYLYATWYRPSLTYAGVAYRIKKQPSFYDYAMGLASGAFSPKANSPQVAALSCALLQRIPHQPEVIPSGTRGSNERFSWGSEQLPSHALSHILGPCRADEMQGFYPFSLTSGQSSLVIQVPKGFLSQFSGDSLTFTLSEVLSLEEKEKNYPLFIWFDDLKDNDIWVEDKRANCFRMNDSLQIKLGERQLLLSFQVKGDQELVGSITRGSRSGLQVKMKEKTVASDVQISLRALRGSSPCEIVLKFSLK
ncbi:MAG: hypothetical protein JSR46_08960, partial [Verrucomicrobia bacterium]|nr:hypothetical protein [Verrucomicrobiota bacterium]